jgi:hypothetical protein
MELLAGLDGSGLLTQAERWMNGRGRELVAAALTLFRSHSWLEAASGLESAFEEPAPFDSRHAEAERLLREWDDAELVLYAARRLAADATGLAGELAACQSWFSEHSELFVAATVYGQGVGMTIRPDLADFDYGLAVTALKYVDVLRATASAEAELALAGVRPLDSQVAQELVARYVHQRRQAAAARFVILAAALRQRMHSRVMAAAGEELTLEPPLWWEWISPEGELLARLTIPAHATQAEEVVLEFVGPDQRRATQLAGQPVTLHGVPATIEPQARAVFPLASLLETAEPLVLRVGPDQTEWNLKQSHESEPLAPRSPVSPRPAAASRRDSPT